MKIHRGREDRRSYLLHTLTTRLGMPRAHTQTLSRTRQVGCWGLHRPPLCAQWRRCHLVEKKQKLLSVGQNPSNPNIPNSKNRIKRKDRHLNKPKSGGKQWKKYFGSDKQILDFDFSCLLFGFPLEQRCVRRPWLASWQGSLQVCFLYLKKKEKKKKTFLDFYLKPKSLTLKGKKIWNQKMLLGSETEVFLTVFTQSATYPWGSFCDTAAQISGYKITVFFLPF